MFDIQWLDQYIWWSHYMMGLLMYPKCEVKIIKTIEFYIVTVERDLLTQDNFHKILKKY